jgi:hypothetical protein
MIWHGIGTAAGPDRNRVWRWMGLQLGTPKTEGASGEHWPMPTAIHLFRRRKNPGARAGRRAGPLWRRTSARAAELRVQHAAGGLVVWQTVAVAMKQAGTAASTVEHGTHAGRRTVVTTLFMPGDEVLEDTAGLVGHTRPPSAADYVNGHGRRLQTVANERPLGPRHPYTA